MKVCIFGAGAIGGYLGTQLASGGCEVSAIARGATLAALREHGMRLQLKDKLVTARVRAEAEPEALGAQDLVVVAVKTPALEEVAARIGPLIAADTMVLTAMNGVPWWFFDRFGGAYEGTRLASIDPTGAIASAIPTRNVMGCVTHMSCSVSEPGLVLHKAGKRLIIGEPDGKQTERLDMLAAMLSRANFDVEVAKCIQADIWYKLWGNMTMNPISAFTGATGDRVLDDPLVNRFCLAVMREAAAIGSKIGCPISQSGEDRNAVTRQLGAFKTSMLQDVEARKPVEIDALVTVVREIGQKVGEPTPNIDILLGLARLHARTHGLYPA
jgi:2-dehydropantoate 2-reductase